MITTTQWSYLLLVNDDARIKGSNYTNDEYTIWSAAPKKNKGMHVVGVVEFCCMLCILITPDRFCSTKTQADILKLYRVGDDPRKLPNYMV